MHVSMDFSNQKGAACSLARPGEEVARSEPGRPERRRTALLVDTFEGADKNLQSSQKVIVIT